MDPSPFPSKGKELLWQNGEKNLIRSVGPHSLHTDLTCSLVLAITVVVVAVWILLIVVNNLTKEGDKFFLQWSRHSSDFQSIAILPVTFYDPVCATDGDTYRNFSNNCHSKATTHNLDKLYIQYNGKHTTKT